MPYATGQARMVLNRILRGGKPEEQSAPLRPRFPKTDPLPAALPASSEHSAESAARRVRFLKDRGFHLPALTGETPFPEPASLVGHIENFVGFASLPVGVIGPLRVNGYEAHGDFYVPLATTEGAMVASYDRGANLISHAGGATVLCMAESVSRSPCFMFRSMSEAGRFIVHVLSLFESLQAVVAGTSRYCVLRDMRTSLIGKEVYLIFDFSTGDAAGQNMVTLATQAICLHLLETAPEQPVHWYVEANLSGDKKATMLAFTTVRGKDVVAEVQIPARLVSRFLHVPPEEVLRYWQISMLGGVQSGSIGVQGHYANGLTALFIACGQDAACVSEAAIGLTRMDLTEKGDLYVSVKLPNLIVGTVGGGTRLPVARDCLGLLGCLEEGGSRKFAEICAALVLAGEISIIGSLAAGDFASAHARLGRQHHEKSNA